MERKEITKKLSNLIEKHINPKNDTRIYYAKEVTFDYGSLEQKRIDYVQFKPLNNSISGIEKGNFYCFEIKSCVDDFNSKNGHNFIGDYNYYVMNKKTYEVVKDRIPYYVGVLTTDDYESLKIIKKVQKHDRTKPIYEMLFMMFRSSNREYIKQRKESKND